MSDMDFNINISLTNSLKEMKFNYFIPLAALVLSLQACKGKTEEHAHETHQEEIHSDEHSGHSHSDEIVIDEHKAEESGIAVMEIHKSQFSGIIKTTGEILPTRENEVTAVSNVSGTVSFINPLLEGTELREGHPVLTINSSKMEGGNISEKAKINFEIAQKEFNRIRNLYNDKLITEKEYNDARQTFEEARINYEAVGNNFTEKGQKIESPSSGFVKSCLVKEGDFVQAGQPLFVIARDKYLYLKAEISGKYYNQLNKITGANFRMPYSENIYDIADLNGEIVSRGKSSGNDSFYIPVTFRFSNSGDIVSGSYAEVFLKTNETKEQIVLPLTAITEEQGTYFVYKQIDHTCYKKAEVQLGISDGKNIEVLSGVKDGEKVVVKGAYQVKLASAVSSIPAHSHEH